MNQNGQSNASTSAATKKKKNASKKKSTAPAPAPAQKTTIAPIATAVPPSPSSAPIDEVYTATADRVDETVQYYQEEEVKKYLSVHPLEMTSLASTMSLGELSNASATGQTDVQPTAAQFSRPAVPSLLSMVISTLFCAIISVVGDGSSSSNTANQNSTDCGHNSDCNVVSVETWSVLEPPKRSVLQMISTVLNACESIGVEAALTDKISGLLHHLVDHVFALPVHVFAFVLVIFRSLHAAVNTLVNLWWSWTVWWICMPLNITVYVIGIMQSVAVNVLVLFLNHAPGGHRVLRALNGHLTTGHRQH